MNEEDLKKKIAEYNEQLKDIEHAETMVKSQINSEREHLQTNDFTDFAKEYPQAKTLSKEIQTEVKVQKPPAAKQERLKSELKKRYQKAKTELKEIQTEIDDYKSKAAELKRRIKNMKDDFKQTPDDQRLENWAKLSDQIKPLSETIIESESAISSLEMRKFAAEQDKEMAAISLEAYKRKLHEKPVEEDPRLKEVLKERDKIAAELEKAEAELE